MLTKICFRTKETLASGNLLSVINVLMQLRKVCNHPNLFEVRPTISPFQCEGIVFHVPSLVFNALDYDPYKVFLKIGFRKTSVFYQHFCLLAHRFVFDESKLGPDGIQSERLPVLPHAAVQNAQKVDNRDGGETGRSAVLSADEVGYEGH